MNEITQVAQGMPWYVLLAGGLFGTVMLIGQAKKWLGSEKVSDADNAASIRSIQIYNELLEKQREETDRERQIRIATEDKYDKLILQYAEVSGKVSELTQQIQRQNEIIKQQGDVIESLRNEIQQLKQEYNHG